MREYMRIKNLVARNILAAHLNFVSRRVCEVMDHSSRIKGIRRRLGLNQVEFAEKLGVSQGTVSRWEKRQQFPSLEALHKLDELGGSSLADEARSSVEQSVLDSWWGRSVVVLGELRCGTFVEEHAWPSYKQLEIRVPDVKSWVGLELFAFIVSDSSARDYYAQGSILICTPFILEKIEPRSGDKVVYADDVAERGFEITLRIFYRRNNGSLVLEGRTNNPSEIVTNEISPMSRVEILAEGGYESLGLLGLVVGSFTIDDPVRFDPPDENAGGE